jgi:dynein heavy chain
MESVHIFSAWFQVGLRPFRQALLNNVSKWGNMFKQHLVDHVTTRWVVVCYHLQYF